MKRILITGGTGNLGKTIVNSLTKIELEIFVLTSKDGLPNSNGVNYIKGDLTKIESLFGLRNNFNVIIHCASNALDSDVVDVQGSKNLLDTILRDKIEHFIYISIVGVDKSTNKYYQNKTCVENFIKASNIPYTVIRATQFHDFVLKRMIKPMDKGVGTKLLVPKNLRFQSIDKKDVAKKTHEVIEKGPSNKTINIGGPEILTLDSMLHSYLTLLKRNEITEFVAPSNSFQKIFATDINLCPDKKYGTISWIDYLNHILSEKSNEIE